MAVLPHHQLPRPSELPEGPPPVPVKQGPNHMCLHCPVRYEATINLQLPTFVLFLLVTLLFMDGHFVHINIFLIATCNQREKWTLYPPAAFTLLRFSTKTDVKSVSVEYILGRAYWLRQYAEKNPSNNKSGKIKCFIVRKFHKLKFLLKH